MRPREAGEVLASTKDWEEFLGRPLRKEPRRVVARAESDSIVVLLQEQRNKRYKNYDPSGNHPRSPTAVASRLLHIATPILLCTIHPHIPHLEIPIAVLRCPVVDHIVQVASPRTRLVKKLCRARKICTCHSWHSTAQHTGSLTSAQRNVQHQCLRCKKFTDIAPSRRPVSHRCSQHRGINLIAPKHIRNTLSLKKPNPNYKSDFKISRLELYLRNTTRSQFRHKHASLCIRKRLPIRCRTVIRRNASNCTFTVRPIHNPRRLIRRNLSTPRCRM